ncbi:MAG: ABC transporter ATP-binding protein [Candidatus Hydrogenedentes bacterium]|nr:ABC transporter ATP-binding protein [Candidatus Hydrogenedentota bacterium]
MTDEPAIKVNGVSRRFGVGHAAVNALTDISLTVNPGDRVAITGPSGSGKTTLLNLIGALDRPSSGSVWVHGHDVSALSQRDASAFRREYLGLVFQDDALIPELTVFENVELPLVLIREPLRSRQSRVHALLEQLGLHDRAHHFPPTLSGGEKQRAAVARAVIHRPKVLLADEPSANLDSHAAEAVMEAISQLAAQNSLTVLVATHDLRIATHFTTRLELRDGCIQDGR